jgi:hypothetical protein
MVRKTFWIIALLRVGTAAPTTKAQTTLTFTGDTTDALTATDVSFDPTTDALTFTLSDADGFLDNQLLIATTDSPSTDSITWSFYTQQDLCLGHPCIVGATLTITDNTPGSTSPAPLGLNNNDDVVTDFSENGNIDISITPKPSTAILWLTGIGLMILTRKRIANLLRLDTATHGSLSPH